MFIESERKGKLEYRPFTPKPDSDAIADGQADRGKESGDADQLAASGRLPSKLVPWYTYAQRFVETIKTKSPKIVVRQSLPDAKVSTVMMLSGLIEVTLKTKGESGGPDIVTITTEAPKYETYALEQEVHGLKQALEINP